MYYWVYIQVFRYDLHNNSNKFIWSVPVILQKYGLESSTLGELQNKITRLINAAFYFHQI